MAAMIDRRPLAVPFLGALLLLAAVVASGCGASSSAAGGAPSVVATTTQLADFVRAVGGSSVGVHQILTPNTDPHEYEPRPNDVSATAGAKLVVLSGNRLDAWMGKVLKEAGGKPSVLTIAPASTPDRVPGETSGPEASRFDPHWWHDPRNVETAVLAIRDALSRVDPGHKVAFARNAAAYEARLRALDAGITRCFAAVPAAQRKLVTDHDAFNYFARHYGITVVGAVIPSQTTQAQASAGAVAKLAALIKREQVKAVFPESSINPKLAQALARDTGATSNLTLYGDTLGPAGSSGATYLAMEQHNADSMVRGFTGGRLGCNIPGL
jgi:zinc/manganese transport system substrate-binding protein